MHLCSRWSYDKQVCEKETAMSGINGLMKLMKY